MRMKFLFGPRYETSVLDDVIKQYFDLMYHDHQFLDAVDCITQKQSYMQDGIYCFFQIGRVLNQKNILKAWNLV